jgi:hypothetical protein
MTGVSFLRSVLMSLAAFAAIAMAFIMLFDPYGVSPIRIGRQHALVDSNQRFMFPQVARSGQFDSVVIGTSTIRLLRPDKLNEVFSGRFANLAMNAATPWEQSRIASLFLKNKPSARNLIVGLDLLWCQRGATIPQRTFRGFPDWLYDDNRLNDIGPMFSMQTLEFSARTLLNRFGLMKARMQFDGYDNFTPPETSYDLAKARINIWNTSGGGSLPAPQVPALTLSQEQLAQTSYPALTILSDLLHSKSSQLTVTLAFMPMHQAHQPRPGSLEDVYQRECKARVAAIARQHGSLLVDFDIPSPITQADENYWDPLHYRTFIADRIVAALSAARSGAASQDYRTLFVPAR